MNQQLVEQGISAIQRGASTEGARMLKIALKDPQLPGPLRAVACLWLARTTSDPAVQRNYWTEALAADPQNATVRQWVEAERAAQMPLPPITPGTPQPAVPSQPGFLPGQAQPQPQPAAYSQPAAPYSGHAEASPFAPQTPSTVPGAPVGAFAGAVSGGVAPQIAAIIGGPNGPGTGFFVAREGLLATTRYVVGGEAQVTVELQSRRQMPGYVVRAYPEYDLALVYVQQPVTALMPVSSLLPVPDLTPLTAVSFSGAVVRGSRRPTPKRVLASHWFPTDMVGGPDAGGSPILDNSQLVLGMLTTNTSGTSGYVYGLHIAAIQQLVEMFRQESAGGGRSYCPHCGYSSRALMAGGYYCESCGALSSAAEALPVRVYQPHMRSFYEQQTNMACPRCTSVVGYHKNTCLRCGFTLGTPV